MVESDAPTKTVAMITAFLPADVQLALAICEKILSSKVLVFFVILTTVLCFGFTITNFSIGVDDPAAYHYLHTDHSGSMIQQGRLFHVLYERLTGSLEFLPFFNDFIGACLLAFSALLFCTLFMYVTSGKLSFICLTIFSCVYISNPIISEKFIYNLDVVVTMASYCTLALALMYACSIGAQKGNIVKTVFLLVLSISSYESFGFLYICGVFAIFILRIVVNNEKLDIKTAFIDGMKFALLLICAYAIYYGLVILVQLLTNQYGLFIRSNPWTGTTEGVLKTFILTTKRIGYSLLLSGYLPVQIFTVCAILGFIFFAVLSFRRKQYILLLCFLGLFLGNLGIHYACGYLMYRAAQTFCFFIAFVILIFAYTFSRNIKGKKIVVAASILLVFVQSAELNRWFYNDYIRYQKESYMVHSIATKLLEQCDVAKPVVFVKGTSMDYLSSNYYIGDQVSGNSAIIWAVGTFGEKDSPLMLQLFKMHGYDFLLPPAEEYIQAAIAEADNLQPWPHESSIAEKEEYIVVKIR